MDECLFAWAGKCSDDPDDPDDSTHLCGESMSTHDPKEHVCSCGETRNKKGYFDFD